MELVFKLASDVFHTIIVNLINYAFCGIVTFFTVRLALKRQTNDVKKTAVEAIMLEGLQTILKSTTIPTNVKAIFVVKKGRFIFPSPSNECFHWFEQKRNTVYIVGGNKNYTSDIRPLYWGVLGVAFAKHSDAVCDFKCS